VDLHVFRLARFTPIPVGSIATDSSGYQTFTYHPDYLEDSRAIALSLALPLNREPFGDSATRAYFDALLPEEQSRRAIAFALGIREPDYLSILSRIGYECVGDVLLASQCDPTFEKPGYTALDARQLRELSHASDSQVAALQIKTRLSLAGAQMKIGLYHDAEQPLEKGWFLPDGLAASTHIVKIPHVVKDLLVNECLIMRTARALGITTADAHLIGTENPLPAVTRFDRVLENPPFDRVLEEPPFDRVLEDQPFDCTSEDPLLGRTVKGSGAGDSWANASPEKSVKVSGQHSRVDGLEAPMRIHQQDFAQALGVLGHAKYELPDSAPSYVERIGVIMRAHSADLVTDARQFLLQMLFNYVVGNSDNHLKNHSFLSTGGSGVRLSPAYDLVSTTALGFSPEMGIKVGSALMRTEVDRDSIRRCGVALGIAPREVAAVASTITSSFEETISDQAAYLAEHGHATALDMLDRVKREAEPALSVLCTLR
jgi:serine/threonine-protein kinase HipA